MGILLFLCLTFMLVPVNAQTADETIVLAPDTAAEVSMSAEQLSAYDRRALILRKLEKQEDYTEMMGSMESAEPAPPGLPPVLGRPVGIGGAADISEISGMDVVNPQLLIIGRNNKNTRANSTLGNNLAEPAAANNARLVFGMGNTHSEYSTDGGVTWTNVAIPAGPSEATIPCCDPDVVIDDARRVTFYSFLYTNADQTNGVVRIFVRPNINSANTCSYTIDPGGTANNILPDYPHLGLTKRYLYLTINAIPTSGFGYARIYRFNLDQMADCVTTSTASYTQSHSSPGQRVWVPAQGTNNIETMYWGQMDNSSLFRIFSWSESLAAPTSVTRAVTTSNFTNPDCRGGVGNFDFIERTTAWQITGFRLRCAAAPGSNGGSGVLACYWNVGTDSLHPQGHVHSAVFNLSGLGLIAQPHIWNASMCWGYPSVTANKRGDIGISIAGGGKAGGGGTAAQGYVGIDDEFTSGVGFFGTLSLTASGTHNRSDGRFGDYFTILPYEPCEKWFTATNYSLSNGSAVINVNSRYVEFGRNQSFRCYKAHKDQFPTP